MWPKKTCRNKIPKLSKANYSDPIPVALFYFQLFLSAKPEEKFLPHYCHFLATFLLSKGKENLSTFYFPYCSVQLA